MTDITPESPAVRLYAALHDYEPTEIDTTQSLLGFFKGQNLDLLAAEHEKIVSERLAAVEAENVRLREAISSAVALLESSPHHEAGAGGMTIDAQIARTTIRVTARIKDGLYAALGEKP